ncbi:MAG: WbqC family protein [Bacteroidetes bacterium]|nr:WbqC family protein [Bacteroidota bacterium]MCL2302726.1 WbqC family protein [Lentimicrobiaceae bacterium]
MTQKLFSTAYLPPIDYLLEMKNADNVFIEAHENYQKQSYRNRATILTGNGLYDLIIPVVRGSEKQIKEIQIDNSMPWQRNHWKTIESAYNNSPYFLYYRDFFEPFFQKKRTFLFDFNMELLDLLRKLFAIKNPIFSTENFDINPKDVKDYRDFFLPKNRTFRPKKIQYQQVFSDRCEFVENLACIDYLFAAGTDF